MAKENGRTPSKRRTAGVPTAQQLKGETDAGLTGDKAAFPDPAAVPLGTDDEAAGAADDPSRAALALREEVARSAGSAAPPPRPPQRLRPTSPNIQIYRPQLTSVLSIANRITGVLLSVGGFGLVVWLIAAALGPRAYGAVAGAYASWPGQVVLAGFTYAFFLHLFGGIRHLVWDTVHGFELGSIYASGWGVVGASVLATAATWGWRAFP